MNSTFIVKLFLFSFVNGTYPSYVKVVFFPIRIMALMSDKGKKNPYILGDHITYIKRTQLSPLFSTWKTTCVLNSWMNRVLWQLLPVMLKARQKVEKNDQSDHFLRRNLFHPQIFSDFFYQEISILSFLWSTLYYSLWTYFVEFWGLATHEK